MSKSWSERITDAVISHAIQGAVASVIAVGGKVAVNTITKVRKRMEEKEIQVREKRQEEEDVKKGLRPDPNQTK